MSLGLFVAAAVHAGTALPFRRAVPQLGPCCSDSPPPVGDCRYDPLSQLFAREANPVRFYGKYKSIVRPFLQTVSKEPFF